MTHRSLALALVGIAAAASLVFTLSDLTAQPAGRVLSASRLLEFATSTPPGGALALVAAAAVLNPVAASAFNPAAAFGRVVAGVAEGSTIWVYLVGCPAGAALAGLAARQPGRQPSREPGRQPSSRSG